MAKNTLAIEGFPLEDVPLTVFVEELKEVQRSKHGNIDVSHRDSWGQYPESSVMWSNISTGNQSNMHPLRSAIMTYEARHSI